MVEYPDSLGSLEIHITLTNRNIDVRILAQGHVLPSLVYPYSKLDIEQDEIRKAWFVNQGRKLNELKDFASFC